MPTAARRPCLATTLNQPLVWDTSKVERMAQTFYGADAFSQDLVWDTAQVYCQMNPCCANFGAFGQCERLVPRDGPSGRCGYKHAGGTCD